MSKRQWKCRCTIVFQLFYLRLSEIALTNTHTHTHACVCMHMHADERYYLRSLLQFYVPTTAYYCKPRFISFDFISYCYFALLFLLLYFVLIAQMRMHNSSYTLTYIQTGKQTDNCVALAAQGCYLPCTLAVSCLLFAHNYNNNKYILHLVLNNVYISLCVCVQFAAPKHHPTIDNRMRSRAQNKTKRQHNIYENKQNRDNKNFQK